MGSAVIEGELWGANVEDWSALAEPQTAPLMHAILKGTRIGKGTTMLDLGCGAGGLCVAARALGTNITGLDASENMLKVAKSRVPDAEFHQGDLDDLPFQDQSFDAVTAINAVQFAADQRRAASEAKRVLKKGGRFGIGMWCEPERCDASKVFEALRPLAPPSDEEPPPTLSIRENLVSVVEDGGFKIVDEGEVECPFVFSSPEEAWRAFRSAGVLVGLMRVVGEEKMRSAVLPAVEPYRTPDGGVRLGNWFRYLICE